MRRWIRRTLTAAGAAVALLVVATTAYAYWTASGTGTASGNTATTLAVTLSPATPSSGLYPGGQSDVKLTISNPNLFAVRIGSMTLDTSQGTLGFDVDGSHSGCTLSTLSFTTQTTGWTVPAKADGADGTLAVTLTNALAMSTTAANACQGATFTVYLVGSA